MDQSKEELLGNIQRLNARAKQQSADLKGQRDALKEIDDELPAKKELIELQNKAKVVLDRLDTQRRNSSEWQNQNTVVREAKAMYDTTQDALSETLVLYMVKTKKKAVHASPSDPASVDREIVTSARVGKKVAANLSLFGEDEA